MLSAAFSPQTERRPDTFCSSLSSAGFRHNTTFKVHWKFRFARGFSMSVVCACLSKAHRSHSDIQSNNRGSACETVRNAVPSFACSTSLHLNRSWHRNILPAISHLERGLPRTAQAQFAMAHQPGTVLGMHSKASFLEPTYCRRAMTASSPLWGCTSQLLLSFCLVSSAFSADCTKLHSVVTDSSTALGTSKRVSWTSLYQVFPSTPAPGHCWQVPDHIEEQTSSKGNINPKVILKIVGSLKNLPKFLLFGKILIHIPDNISSAVSMLNYKASRILYSSSYNLLVASAGQDWDPGICLSVSSPESTKI